MAIDARSRIPARIGLQRIVDAHGDHVGLAVGPQPGRQVVLEGDIAIGPLTQGMAVDPHLTALIDAVELDGDALATSTPRQGHDLAIPADTGRRIAAGTTGRGMFVQRQAKAPVVRQMHAAPSGRGKARVLGARRVSRIERPAVVEADPAPLAEHGFRHGRRHGKARRGHQRRGGSRLRQKAHQAASRQGFAHDSSSCMPGGAVRPPSPVARSLCLGFGPPVLRLFIIQSWRTATGYCLTMMHRQARFCAGCPAPRHSGGGRRDKKRLYRDEKRLYSDRIHAGRTALWLARVLTGEAFKRGWRGDSFRPERR